jgi:hypothetical protein
MQAAQELGISPQQFRGNPAVMDKVTQYLNQKYPGQNWTNGGARAGDWVSANGQGFDVLPAGDANWQWLSDPANSTAGSGGDSGYGGFASTGLTPTQQIEQTPGYQFSVDQAMNAIQHSAAARGTLLSGGLMKNLGSYIANSVAGPAYQQQVGNLYNLATMGGNAAAAGGRIGTDYANAGSGLYGDIGNAQAAGTVGSANAWNGALGGVADAINKGIGYKYGNQDPYGYPNGYPGFPGGGRDPFAANASGYAANGVNQTGVTYVPAGKG